MFRSPARLFAPVALVACAVAILMIVNANSGAGGSKTSSTATGSSTTATTKQPVRRHHKHYVVKQGDVLSQIAIKTGVPLATIQELNPTVDAQSLHAGQKLKLVP